MIFFSSRSKWEIQESEAVEFDKFILSFDLVNEFTDSPATSFRPIRGGIFAARGRSFHFIQFA